MELEKDITDQDKALARGKCQDPDFATLIKTAAFPHIDSFNFAMSEGLVKVVQYLKPLEIFPLEMSQSSSASQKETTNYAFKRMKVWYQDIKLGYFPYNSL